MTQKILNNLEGADNNKLQLLGKEAALDIAKRFSIAYGEYMDLCDAEKRFDEETKIIDEEINFDKLSPEEIEVKANALTSCFDKISDFWNKVTNTIGAAKEADALVEEILTLVSSQHANKNFNETLGKSIKEASKKLQGEAKNDLDDCGDKILEFSKNRQNGAAVLTDNNLFIFHNDKLIVKHPINNNPLLEVKELLPKYKKDIKKLLLWGKLCEQKNEIKDIEVETFSF